MKNKKTYRYFVSYSIRFDPNTLHNSSTNQLGSMMVDLPYKISSIEDILDLTERIKDIIITTDDNVLVINDIVVLAFQLMKG